ncbi:type II toxin-antitoxin system VapC family toxin [Variovorax sp. J22G73]|jgi:tRNA(fMet)-specific endonuclease VapC|uniref:type II toxin-antitoxin system VapC family toxin n=1 Tax=unclassified Variovorax TaxID=663243 RepID=UPI000D5ED451|nr:MULTISPECIES: type II toxin-antitoxin system VapC family toxin [unclassified Variovorax]MDM0003331.1 type II toxin-antitoxin system VapC family toxin [Variovorax sp. J22R203]MDM0097003.1 type II toxin-antitoxin system VapC family toxin [Variovorax sp. J22G73]
MFLLDTNALIYAFKGQGRYRERIDATDPARLHVSNISLFEIEFGLARSSNPAPMRIFIEDARRRHVWLPLDPTSAIRAGQLRQALSETGTPIGPYDLLIAGTALALNLIVVTRNIREFTRVPGLRVENWYD